MCSHAHALYLFSKLKPGWEFCASDACGLSGGLLAGWDPHLIRCKAFTSLAGIVLKATFKGLDESFTVINCYGPYIHRTNYWNSLVSGGLLGLPNLILAGILISPYHLLRYGGIKLGWTLWLTTFPSLSLIICWWILRWTLVHPLGETAGLGMREYVRDWTDS